MKRKVIRTGNSLAITIPAEFVKKAEIRPGDELEYYVDLENFKIVCSVINKPRQLFLIATTKKKK